MVRYSFPVGLSHSLLHAGLSRRTHTMGHDETNLRGFGKTRALTVVPMPYATVMIASKIQKGSWVTLPGTDLVGVVTSRRGKVVKVKWPDNKTRLHTRRFLIKVDNNSSSSV